MAKGTEDLEALINQVVEEMMANDEMQKLYDDNIKLAVDQIVTD
jgi:hypothetical protein